MKKNGRTKRMITIFILSGLIYGVAAHDIGYSEGLRTVNKIVKNSSYNAMAIKNKAHDIINTPILDGSEKAINEKGEDLRGNIIIIMYDSKGIAYVTVYPYMREAKKEKRIKPEKEDVSIVTVVEEKIT